MIRASLYHCCAYFAPRNWSKMLPNSRRGDFICREWDQSAAQRMPKFCCGRKKELELNKCSYPKYIKKKRTFTSTAFVSPFSAGESFLSAHLSLMCSWQTHRKIDLFGGVVSVAFILAVTFESVATHLRNPITPVRRSIPPGQLSLHWRVCDTRQDTDVCVCLLCERACVYACAL